MQTKPTIEYPDFEKLDLRIGRVVSAAAPEWSHKLLEFKVDFGEEVGERTILSGVRAVAEPETFVGNSYIFVINLDKRKMGEGFSEGMMIMSDEATGPVPLALSQVVTPGAVVR